MVRNCCVQLTWGSTWECEASRRESLLLLFSAEAPQWTSPLWRDVSGGPILLNISGDRPDFGGTVFWQMYFFENNKIKTASMSNLGCFVVKTNQTANWFWVGYPVPLVPPISNHGFPYNLLVIVNHCGWLVAWPNPPTLTFGLPLASGPKHPASISNAHTLDSQRRSAGRRSGACQTAPTGKSQQFLAFISPYS